MPSFNDRLRRMLRAYFADALTLEKWSELVGDIYATTRQRRKQYTKQKQLSVFVDLEKKVIGAHLERLTLDAYREIAGPSGKHAPAQKAQSAALELARQLIETGVVPIFGRSSELIVVRCDRTINQKLV